MQKKDKLLANRGTNVYNESRLKQGDDSVRIAICDDEAVHRDKLQAAISNFFGKSEGVDIEKFDNGKTLIQANKERPFNIIFLDIEMPGLSGIDTGASIRREDKTVLIIFVTNHEDLVFESLKVEIFDFIRKPRIDTELHGVLRRAVNKSRDQLISVEIKCTDTRHVLNIGDIVYFEIDRRHLKIVTVKSEYKSAEKMDYYDKLLSQYGFFRSHKSFLVNMGFIKDFTDNEIITVFNNKVDLSVRNKSAFLRAYNDFQARYRI